MTKDYTNSDDGRQTTLQKKIGDNSIERGIPQDLDVRKKHTVRNVLLLIAGLLVAAFLVFRIIGFFGSEETAEEKPKEEKIEPEGVEAGKKFAADKREIEEAEKEMRMLAASEAAASEAVASSPDITTAVDKQAVTNETGTAASAVEIDERLDAGLTPDGVESAGKAGYSDEVSAIPVSGKVSSAGGNEAEESEEGLLSDSGGKPNPLTSRLKSGTFKAGVAEDGGDTSYILTRGTGIPCVTTTKIVTTHPGLTRCQVKKDVYSGNGKTLLVERGSTIIGEQTSALTQGQARVFALWSDLVTPAGIRVKLDSPGGDPLGASGHPAKVRHHFWQRFGGAVMISLISDVGTGLSNMQNRTNGSNNHISYENTSDAAQEMATEALKNSINIPPTGYVNQGTEIMVYVARDVDFSGVYENVSVRAKDALNY